VDASRYLWKSIKGRSVRGRGVCQGSDQEWTKKGIQNPPPCPTRGKAGERKNEFERDFGGEGKEAKSRKQSKQGKGRGEKTCPGKFFFTVGKKGGNTSELGFWGKNRVETHSAKKTSLGSTKTNCGLKKKPPISCKNPLSRRGRGERCRD